MATKRNKYNGGHIGFSPVAAMEHLRKERERAQLEENNTTEPSQSEHLDYAVVSALERARDESERLSKRVKELENKINEMESATDWKPGWVYLIKELSNGHCKIGKTTNIDDRLHTFGVKLPFKIEFICTIRAKNYHQLEKELHGMFTLKRIGGSEWFALDEDDISFIRSLED